MGKYDDIILMPYKKSNARKQMSMLERAAQFSPFAALTGYDDAIDECARLTDQKIILSEDEKTQIGETLKKLSETIKTRPFVRIGYFVPDDKKAGGSYRTAEGEIKKIKVFEKIIVFSTGEEIAFSDILFIDADIQKCEL